MAGQMFNITVRFGTTRMQLAADTIDTVKAKIQDKEGVHPKYQQLSHDQLQEGMTLELCLKGKPLTRREARMPELGELYQHGRSYFTIHKEADAVMELYGFRCEELHQDG